ncbi:hypothetical protein D3OALGA1CA_4652 [Olavius algarvensis associated proteobacterium Delta 3]|nr:hypothetical protein D3OALGB2SA_4842 [Olavius algarvensis associated proteobacterium Delta 3]CAB5154799.1 hypothetical protein D3OALGA1CA_4652 [Olavius algarvensis associated proteobacterium Delta 3]
MNRILMTLLIAVLLALQYGQTDAATMFPSDWQIVDQGDQDGPSLWQYDRGVWNQTSNIFGGQQGTSLPEKPGTFMVAMDSDFSDGSVLLSLVSDDDDGIGIMFRYQDASNYYRFSMDRQRKYRRLVKVVDGIVTVLAEDALEYEKGRWYEVEIKTEGYVIDVIIDGRVILHVTDRNFDSGKLALYCWGNTSCRFRDVKIEPLSRAVSENTPSDKAGGTDNLAADGDTHQHEIKPRGNEALRADPGSNAAQPAQTSEPAYIIGPGDILEVSVWRDEALTKQLVVLPDGRISFPLIGEVQAAGKTLSQLKVEMSERLDAFVPNPEVHLAVKGIGSMVISLVGKVRSPGRYPIGQNMDVLEALAMAGGLTPFARKKEIRIFRQKKEQTEIFYFNYNEVAEGKHLEQNIELKRGDVIVVP